MEEVEFLRPELEHKDIIEPYFKEYPSRSCERTFTNIYLWSRFYPVTWAKINGAIVFKSQDENHTSFAFPVGDNQAKRDALQWIEEYYKERNLPFELYHITNGMFNWLEEEYPDKYQIEYDRDLADYVYDREKLATLAGKKLHSKRNHINNFIRTYDNWTYEKLSLENRDACFDMALEWRRENDVEVDPEKVAETAVTLNSLRLFEELGLIGGVLKIDGEVVAFTVGEPLSSDTFVVHIEKARADIQGAYPMINQQFVSNEMEGYTYVNREEDTGAEGLRKAKLSYKPVFLEEKGIVTLK
ncbi:MAG: phosphatidylglycerol lysyltransferase domain-containing protein [Lachnospiraceae bacterium]|jgi:hypothetical protein|nr:phosphatidylglycerol lysyltransferase domain-containing protein [Lachnospiraceae bacterium]